MTLARVLAQICILYLAGNQLKICRAMRASIPVLRKTTLIAKAGISSHTVVPEKAAKASENFMTPVMLMARIAETSRI